MYYDYLLKFIDKTQADSVLYTEEPSAEHMPSGVYQKSNYYAIDVIGTIYKSTGSVIDTAEGPTTEMITVPGWHVNVRHTSPAPELTPYSVTPITPSRMWA